MFVRTFCLESLILSHPKVVQIPPESPCMCRPCAIAPLLSPRSQKVTEVKRNWPWPVLHCLVASLLPCWPGFNPSPMSVCVGFVVDKVALRWSLLQVLLFFLFIVIPALLCTYSFTYHWCCTSLVIVIIVKKDSLTHLVRKTYNSEIPISQNTSLLIGVWSRVKKWSEFIDILCTAIHNECKVYPFPT